MTEASRTIFSTVRPETLNLRASLFQEADHRFDAQLEVFQVELLVGGVDVVVGQAEAHHDAGNAQMAVKIADDGDGAAGADEDRLLAPDLAKGGGGKIGRAH